MKLLRELSPKVQQLWGFELMTPPARNVGMKNKKIHFATITSHDLITSSTIGRSRAIKSTVSMKVHGKTQQLGGGVLYDIGTYCLNSVRHLFESNPAEVFGYKALRTKKDLFKTNFEMDIVFLPSSETSGPVLHHVIGTRGTLTLSPNSDFTQKLKCEVTIGTAEHFGSEISEIEIVRAVLRSANLERPIILNPSTKLAPSPALAA
jgi:predicted dehydrogenase